MPSCAEKNDFEQQDSQVAGTCRTQFWLLKSSCAGKFVGHAEKSITDSKSLPNYDVNQPRYGS